MAIALIVTDRDTSNLKQQIHRLLEQKVEVWSYPDIPAPDRVEMLVLWKQPSDLLHKFEKLQLISSLGAGVEHILSDPSLPPLSRIVRIVDPSLSASMNRYIALCVLMIQKQLLDYMKNKAQKQWSPAKEPELNLKIGILGMGQLGQSAAATLSNLGFEVIGFSRHTKKSKVYPV